jgi:hypothetical protein
LIVDCFIPSVNEVYDKSSAGLNIRFFFTYTP